MKKLLILSGILSGIILIVIAVIYFNKGNNEYLILTVNSNNSYNISIINLTNNDSKNLGEYSAKNKEIRIKKNKIISDTESLAQYFIILENKQQYGVGLYTYFSSEKLSIVTEVDKNIQEIYNDKYPSKISISFYDKANDENISTDIIQKNNELKVFFNEDECIKEERGIFITNGYDFLGNEIGSLFMYNSMYTMSMNNQCSSDYANVNVMNNFIVAEITINNNNTSYKYVIPIKWIPSFVKNYDLAKDDYSIYNLNNKDIELEIYYQVLNN